MHTKNKEYMRAKTIISILLLLCLNLSSLNLAVAAKAKTQETPQTTASTITQATKNPDYATTFVGEDKYENLNRKVFVFNSKLNKFVIKPIQIVWASVMPKYGMDRIESAFNNIEYPKRLASCLIQKDFKGSGRETVRFFTNTTIGLAGMYDPAKSLFKIEPTRADMDKALAKCKVKSGPYLVVPVMASATPRSIAGKVLETALEPTWYFASPLTALVKTGLLMNRNAYMQPLIKMVESTYADPYEIAKKMYGIENYIKTENIEKQVFMNTSAEIVTDVSAPVVSSSDPILYHSTKQEAARSYFQFTLNDDIFVIEKILKDNEPYENPYSNQTLAKAIEYTDITPQNTAPNKTAMAAPAASTPVKTTNTYSDMKADIELNDYCPQCPVTDSMRTALFELPGINDSMWTELSIWNRCFAKQIKTASVNVTPSRVDYKYRYILQKDKNAPVAILYPSIGEGAASHHLIVLAKLFYDEGYSVVMQGSHFQWEFTKSMPETYRPGIPAQDAQYLRLTTAKVLESIEKKHECKFREKVLMGTSFGAMQTLFIASQESKENTLNISRYIAVNPPIELVYAIKQLDYNNAQWDTDPDDLKHRVALTAAKVLKVAEMKNDKVKIDTLPFTEEEAKLITGFIMHQKLSDLIFTIENGSKSTKSDVYKTIADMNYQDYAQKYLLTGRYKKLDDLTYEASLYSIAPYLKSNNNYKIYHTFNDYFVNKQQLVQLKSYAGNRVVFLNNGAHLGFLYRPEFIDSLKKDITMKNEQVVKAGEESKSN